MAESSRLGRFEAELYELNGFYIKYSENSAIWYPSRPDWVGLRLNLIAQRDLLLLSNLIYHILRYACLIIELSA